MCSPFWVSFFREINWQSARIYQHIARLSDKLKQWGNQLWPCRCVQSHTRTLAPTLPHHDREPGKSWVGQMRRTYLFICWSRSFISRYKWPWRLTTTDSPPPTPPSPVLPSSASLRHDLCVINIKNTQITEEQWIPLEAEDTEQRCKLFFFFPGEKNDLRVTESDQGMMKLDGFSWDSSVTEIVFFLAECCCRSDAKYTDGTFLSTFQRGSHTICIDNEEDLELDFFRKIWKDAIKPSLGLKQKYQTFSIRNMTNQIIDC